MDETKYMIHACPDRMWYVLHFLIPDMKRQGIPQKNIYVWNDADRKGNLASWLTACEFIRDHFPADGGVWHLQDDIILSDRFAEVTQASGTDMIINGWVSKRFNKERYRLKGVRAALDHWNSFPCIFIPNMHVKGFLEWFDTAQGHPKYKRRIDENKWDDYLFWQYMRKRHSDEKVLNLAPNIIDHVDYIIGGSMANPNRIGTAVSCYWSEQDKTERLKEQVQQWHDCHKTIKGEGKE